MSGEPLPLDAPGKPYRPGTLLLIEWEDSATESASLHWMGGKDLRDALERNEGTVECTTVGFFVHQTRRALTVCQNFSSSNCVSHVISIPLSAILYTEVLIEPEDEDDPGLELDTYRAQAQRDLLPLLQALHAVLARGKPPPQNLINVLALTAAQQAVKPAGEAFGETLASLVRVRTLPQQAQAVALKLAVPKGALLAQRAVEVLTGRSEAYVDPYTRLATQVLIFDSHREGAAEGGRQGGATHKTFTRIRPVAEPRAHSVLEGKRLPIAQPFIIAGVACFGPGDDRLPWSERGFCGHVLKFSRGG